ncbi:hypothetical protein E4T56_gene20381 [Termitomyces sp. T112]|nr:hypothetical protein E4T56_gene20381 [Termitomyces sp. T112]
MLRGLLHFSANVLPATASSDETPAPTPAEAPQASTPTHSALRSLDQQDYRSKGRKTHTLFPSALKLPHWPTTLLAASPPLP